MYNALKVRLFTLHFKTKKRNKKNSAWRNKWPRPKKIFLARNTCILEPREAKVNNKNNNNNNSNNKLKIDNNKGILDTY